MSAPLVRMSFSVSVSSDHVGLTEGVNRFKVVLPDQLLEVKRSLVVAFGVRVCAVPRQSLPPPFSLPHTDKTNKQKTTPP